MYRPVGMFPIPSHGTSSRRRSEEIIRDSGVEATPKPVRPNAEQQCTIRFARRSSTSASSGCSPFNCRKARSCYGIDLHIVPRTQLHRGRDHIDCMWQPMAGTYPSGVRHRYGGVILRLSCLQERLNRYTWPEKGERLEVRGESNFQQRFADSALGRSNKRQPHL